MPPARRQVDKATLDDYLKERRPEGGTYNIWHNRWKGLERDWSKKGVRAKFKCNVARDSGDTIGSSNRNAYFCLFFAKGMCAQGPQCSMWHRIPNERDEIETTIDCFGRDKYMEFRQDMGGVGSFNTQNKTLYVGRISSTDNMRDVVTRHFEQFGKLERIRLLRHRGVAFVTYKSRSNAEFAREAMMNQGLDNNEIINVRWATAEQATMLGDDDHEEDHGSQYHIPEELYEGQDTESELPAEYTRVKRELDEDGFKEMEESAKRQKDENISHSYGYPADEQSARAIYGYTQHAPAPAAQAESSQKAGGIISMDIIKSLKPPKDTKNATEALKEKGKAAQPGGLGSIASYGSDSSSDEE
ncbi:hypothetical protein BJV82DRAFT_673512 [Fennellomyces sp. T-0311]|nr:hypothetical protein BJV82DRAFT_673512 [Fennellomyces sp. T-0311]